MFRSPGTLEAMARASYHHGDLRRVLIDSTATLIHEEGAGGFSLREVARRAGVSPAAPSYHFGDTRGLLTAVAIEGFERMVEAFAAIDVDQDPHHRLVEHGHAYIDLAIKAPGHRAVMFRHDLIDSSNEDYVAVAPRAYQLIYAAVADAVGDVDGIDLDTATKTVWATCHGIADLYVSGGDAPDDPTLGPLIEQATSIVYRGLRAT